MESKEFIAQTFIFIERLEMLYGSLEIEENIDNIKLGIIEVYGSEIFADFIVNAYLESFTEEERTERKRQTREPVGFLKASDVMECEHGVGEYVGAFMFRCTVCGEKVNKA